MSGEIKMHDIVALLQDVRISTSRAVRLCFCAVARSVTVVMTYPDGAREVEFADRDGRALCHLTPSAHQLMVLHDTGRDFAAT